MQKRVAARKSGGKSLGRGGDGGGIRGGGGGGGGRAAELCYAGVD